MYRNEENRRSGIVTTLVVFLVCLVLVTGSTFSLFTSQTGTNIAITSGNVEMVATLGDLALYSKGVEQTGKFENGGTAALNDEKTGLTITNITPGDSVVLTINLQNNSTVDLAYRVTWEIEGTLAGALVATIDGDDFTAGTSEWTEWTAPVTEDDKAKTITVAIELPITAGNEWMNKDASISFAVDAVQANATGEYSHIAYVSSVAGLNTALANVKDGDVIKFNTDIKVTDEEAIVTGTWLDGIVYIGDESFTIDLNGHTLTDDGSLNDYLIYLKNNGEKANEITIKNGSITVASQTWSAIAVNSASYSQTSVLNLDNVIVTVGNKENWSNDAIRARHGATINLNEGTVINSVGTAYGVTANYTGVLNINSGAKVIQSKSGTSGGNHPYSAVSGTGTVNIYEGAVIESDCYGIHNMTTLNPVINIYGGTITAPNALHASTNGAADQSATINVYNGTINGALSTYSANGNIVVTGGVFTADPSDYVADGYIAVKNENNTYSVVKGVKVSGTDELADALANAQDGDTVMLSSNMTITNSVIITGEVTLELAGNTVTNNDVAAIVIDGGSLIVKDSSGNGAIIASSTSSNNDDKAAILFGANGGKFVMESGTLKSTKYGVRSYNISSSEIVINGGTIEAESYGVYDNAGSVTVNGGEINAGLYGIAAYGKFTMNGGTSRGLWSGYVSNGSNDATVVVINGGTISASQGAGIYWPSAGSLTINGGAISGGNAVYVKSGSVTITGGTLIGVSSDEQEGYYYVDSGYTVTGDALAIENVGGDTGYQAITSVSITGGNFKSESAAAVASYAATTKVPEAVAVTGFIKGGTYSSDPSAYLAKGYVTVESNGVWTIAMKEHTVSSVDELIAAIEEGGKITLTQNVEVASTLKITADTVIDGNGATLTYTGSDRAITVAPVDGAVVDLTISNLTVDCSASYCNRAINYNETGSLVLNNVNVTGAPTYGINLQALSDGVNVEVNGGSYSACIPLNIWGENSVIVANDVEFITVDNSDAEGYACISLNNDGTNSANGSVVTINGGSITVAGTNTNGSYAVRNMTHTGVINISSATTVTGKIEEYYVSVVKYEGTNDYYSHSSLQTSVECVEQYNSGWIVLLTNVTIDSLAINGNVSIDTNGFELNVGSYTGSGTLTVDGTVVYGN